MKKTILIILFLFLSTSSSYAGFFDDLMKSMGISSEEETADEETVISGLKEALLISTKNAVKNVSAPDGYLGNQAIKILLPEKIQKIAEVLKKVGYQKEVDDFVISMNRAAERAAPKATSLFVEAIKEMTFDDARKILNGGDTAATDYLKSKTSEKLYEEFRPVVSSSMNEVGVTRYYKGMMNKYSSLPFMKSESIDLDHYVTSKALDGLFYMMAEEEKKIRTNPAARVTELLKKVFGNK